MNEQESKLAKESAELKEAQSKGGFSKFKTYTRLAGPGWLQSALMLGGGSLAGSLYLGVLTGVNAIWLQPLAMILTIVMFGALSYVVLSTGERPFQAINKHINPVLGWSWALASLVSCMVWAMPQYALASAVLQQNLAPGLLGTNGLLGDMPSKIIIAGSIFAVVTSVAWRYSDSGRGVRIFEWALKAMIYVVVACFIGVVVRLALLSDGLDWSGIVMGLIPDPSLFFKPSEGFIPLLNDIPGEFRGFWEDIIVSRQREVIIAVAAAAGGVNATFLLAYSMIRRGWGKEYRGLAIFDLSTGMLIPFALATTCVIIAASHQFHTAPQPGFVPVGDNQEILAEPSTAHVQEFEGLLTSRVQFEALQVGNAELSDTEIATNMAEISDPERVIAATLITRDAIDLATSLEPLTGSFFARVIFGIGILGMTISTVVLHMLVSGMVICEMLGRPHTGWTLRIGSLAAATGILGPFLWQKAAFWLAIPTSIFAFILLPSAYFTFYLMLNKRSLMGSEIPTGYKGYALNLVMILVIVLFCVISAYVIWTNAGMWGMAALVAFLAAIVAGHFSVKNNQQTVKEYEDHHS